MQHNLLIGILGASLIPAGSLADEVIQRPAEGIQDNSFLVEEAYNQQAGEVQHLFTLRRDVNQLKGPDDRDWEMAFTQEWPLFTQTHQVSYTIPYSVLERRGSSVNGISDVSLHYRIQAIYESDTRPAFAPRFSLILPTGSESKGLGNNTVGYQWNLPLSKIITDRWTLHANAGLTLFPDLNGRDPIQYNLGGSAIYAITPRFNLMLETVGEWTENVTDTRDIERGFDAVISPGVRYAVNFSSSQLVLGLGVPIGLTGSAPDYGVLFYLSFEHQFRDTTQE